MLNILDLEDSNKLKREVIRQFCRKPVKNWKVALGILKEISYIFECNPSRWNFAFKRGV